MAAILEPMDEETEKKWTFLLDGLFIRLEDMRNDPSYQSIRNEYAYKIKYFIASVDDLKNNRDFKNYLNNFGPQNQTDIWDWLSQRDQSILKDPFFHFQGFITTTTHHLFLYGFKLCGDKLILGAYYTTSDKSAILPGNSVLTFCKLFIPRINLSPGKCFFAVAPIGGMALDLIPTSNWTLYLSYIGTFCGLIQLESVSEWIKTQIEKNTFLTAKEAILTTVMIEMLLHNLQLSAYELKLPVKFRHAIVYYFGGEKAYLRTLKIFKEEDTLDLLPKEEEEAPLKSPSKRKADDGAGDQSAGAGTPIKKSKSNEDLTHVK